MVKKLTAIGFIFVCTSIAWMILGGTIFARTYSSDSHLKAKVERIWGTQQTQQSPHASYTIEREREEEKIVDGEKVVNVVKYKKSYIAPLVASDLKVDLGLGYRQKGLLWYSTYKVDFSGSYRFENDSGENQNVKITLPFPAQFAVYDDFEFAVRGRKWSNKPRAKDGRIMGVVGVAPGEVITVDIGYRSQGLDRWSYRFGKGVAEIKNFQLTMETDFRNIDFPDDSIAPSVKDRTGSGWKLTWQFENLVSGVNIGMLMPQKLQPGPLVGRISFFAPVSLLFFLIVTLVIGLVKRIDLHPMHFFFLSSAFFAFHLLLAYLVDHISVHLAFVISSFVSLILVASYLRTAVSRRFAFVEAAGAQLIYLILFSYAFFFKGLTGLAITIGAITTLFVMMQMTAKVNWNEVFAKVHRPTEGDQTSS